MHLNVVSKKWNLVNGFADYEHSSASFYEKGIKKYENIVHVNGALSITPGVSAFNTGAMREDPGRTGKGLG